MAMTRARIREAAVERWWARAWDVVVLGVDPGRRAGASIIDSSPGSIRLIDTREIDTETRELESFLGKSIEYARTVDKRLVLAVEDWGAGGHRGLAQWIGLGEQRGAWTRAYQLSVVNKPMIVKIPQSRWRSRLCETYGAKDSLGRFRQHTSQQWKRVAYDTARVLIPDAHVPITENAAESICIGYFAARSDAVGKLLGKKRIAASGQTFEELEWLVHPKKAKKTKGSK